MNTERVVNFRIILSIHILGEMNEEWATEALPSLSFAARIFADDSYRRKSANKIREPQVHGLFFHCKLVIRVS